MSRASIHMIDTTLRDGLQAPGIMLRLDEKIRLAEQLLGTGVDEIEAGIPVRGEEEQTFLQYLSREFRSKGLITGWCRPLPDDLAAAQKACLDSVHISFSVSTRLFSLHRTDPQRVLDSIRKILTEYKSVFRHISIGAQDALRADPDFLSALVNTSREAGAWKIRLADTVGDAIPSRISALFSRLDRQDMHLEFHGHNDLGMSVGNSLVALDNGARSLSATLLGIGERAGNTPIEELATALSLSDDYKTGIELPALCAVAYDFADRIREPIHPRKPVCGSLIFSHESGIHAHGLLKDRLSYQPFLPEHVGHQPERFLFGPSSGASTIVALLNDRDFTGVDLRRMAAELREEAQNSGRFFRKESLLSLVEEKIASKRFNAYDS